MIVVVVIIANGAVRICICESSFHAFVLSTSHSCSMLTAFWAGAMLRCNSILMFSLYFRYRLYLWKGVVFFALGCFSSAVVAGIFKPFRYQRNEAGSEPSVPCSALRTGRY